MPTRAQLDADLHALEQTLPVRGTADAGAFDHAAFHARIAELMRIATPDDQEHVRRRGEQMLLAAGLEPPPGPVVD
jgi:hypothetical protein